MNSTTSLPFTSLSMNCSMPMELSSFRGGPTRRTAERDICSAKAPVTPRGIESYAKSRAFRGIKGAFDLENVVLVQPGDLNDGARRVRSARPELFLHLVHQR